MKLLPRVCIYGGVWAVVAVLDWLPAWSALERAEIRILTCCKRALNWAEGRR